MSRLRGCALHYPFFTRPKYTPSNSQVKLPHFISYALHRTKFHSSVTSAALVLLQNSRRALFNGSWTHALVQDYPSYNRIH
ncbi:hypothetical protein DFJ58DRAFT_423757 [Suillus subalutaceus]|uniref:uncharacterized protein n=1 Tax=Suillus subalutaceus TaxID=48586 RepID=UPI001B880155|nr:uncharacterized protein DFJ58DRAFT_423757 [Suillus subalutaceus]KAG1851444.1 hypothetical protein DFJ58DRAFT_423757 [Suillus subalutaceus]